MAQWRKRPPLTPVEKERNLESVVLLTLIEFHPKLLTEVELIREMTADTNASGRAAATKLAVAGLISVGLLDRRGALLVPTGAALRVGEFEMGH